MFGKTVLTLALMALPVAALADTFADRATRSLGGCLAAYDGACTAQAQDPQACLLVGMMTCERLHRTPGLQVTAAMLRVREMARANGYAYSTALSDARSGGPTQEGSDAEQAGRGRSAVVEEISDVPEAPSRGGIDRDDYSATTSSSFTP
ncbi:MAG: hypothetical protein AAGA70_02760 [Pseudomonadota bacterium]